MLRVGCPLELPPEEVDERQFRYELRVHNIVQTLQILCVLGGQAAFHRKLPGCKFYLRTKRTAASTLTARQRYAESAICSVTGNVVLRLEKLPPFSRSMMSSPAKRPMS
jgi:hypothetical protein